MAKSSRLAVGVGIVGIGLVAALPFSRTPPPPPANDALSGASNAPASEDQPGPSSPPALAMDRPQAPLNVPLPAAPPTQVASEPVVEDAFPKVPRLLETSELPSLAESFEEAVVSGPDVPTRTTAHSLQGPVAAQTPIRLGPPIAWPNAADPDGSPASTNQPSPAIAATAQPGSPPATEPPPFRRHRIRDGDTLPALARRFLGDESRYLEIFAANRDLLAHPELLPLGVELKIPQRANGAERP